jgi:pyruvate,water dikinase
MIDKYVLHFSEIDKSSLAEVGGKGANLGELYRISGIEVPVGFCVSTKAYRDFVNTGSQFAALLKSLDAVDVESPEELKEAGYRIRTHLESLDIPAPIQQEIAEAWQKTGSQFTYAIRSSATAEDLPGASFAGQQDTFLNIEGLQNILNHARKCWASLFTDRAIAYRAKNGFPHDQVLLSVVVQRMVFPEISGILFTADPVTGNRKVVSIDASFGLGEALVSGLVSADLYQVKQDQLIKKQIAEKKIAVYARPEGGTDKVAVEAAKQLTQVLTDEDAFRLARMGRSIEKHFGSPQDIEWCLVDKDIFIVQSRPITTLYPAPRVADNNLHLFLSIGHQQMMTDAMKPLGISVIRTLVPFGKSEPQAETALLQEVGGRLYFDVNHMLAYPELRKRLPGILLTIDELIGRAVQDFIDREEFRAMLPSDKELDFSVIKKAFPTGFAILRNLIYRDDDHAFKEINQFMAQKVKEHQAQLQETSGADRIAIIQKLLPTLMPSIFMRLVQYIGTALITFKLIESLSKKWLGDVDELRSISKSPPGNVTTEMGLALGDLADTIRNYPEIIEYLKQANDHTFWDDLKHVPGAETVIPAFLHFLAMYGMRATGEIDVTRPRWREAPTQLIPAILSHIKGVSPGQHRRDFLAGKQEAEQAAVRLLDRLRDTPGGLFKARRMQRLIKVHRAFIGFREHPKYFIVQHFDLVKQAIVQEAGKLAKAGVLEQAEDVFWLSLQEIKEVIETGQINRCIIAARKERYEHDIKLTPPRAITSEGEIITAKPGAQVPPGALAGSPVSAGVTEGRARVILRLEEARMDKGDILVTPYTDPGWTPLFPLASGLVTEVGGLMTHGAVVAREYGIPAVVGVDRATQKIRDGQRIRVNGTQGFVEIID